MFWVSDATYSQDKVQSFKCWLSGDKPKRFMGKEVLAVCPSISQSESEQLSQDNIIELLAQKWQCVQLLTESWIGRVMCIYSNPGTFLFEDKHRYRLFWMA